MYAQPDDPAVIERMRTAHGSACTALDVRPDSASSSPEVWGWQGRTYSRAVTASDGRAWLRLAGSLTERVNATFWNGSLEAERSLPLSVPRPRLRDTHDWTDGPWSYRAELYDHEPEQPVSPTPTLMTAPDLPPTWWTTLAAALTHIAAVPTRRLSVHQPFLDRAMPRYLGTPVTTEAPSWSTAHGDLHFANLCAPTLRILDWEGWGLAPTGYDAAVLHTHSLLVPPVTARIRHEFAHLLATSAGRHAELVVITQLLHTSADLRLRHALRTRAAHVLGRPLPP
ncbi:hypothetical protein OG900_20535 [Streptomyces sp. NBC_00433]